VKTQSIDSNMYFNNGSVGGGPGGGVVRLADSTALGLNLTQVSVDDFGSYPPLTNSGVPFAYVDRSVANNFTYFYGVQAIDINSLASGPYSLSSSRVLTRVTPRQDAQNLTEGRFSMYVASADGTPLEYGAIPSVDSETGIFSGPFPPTDNLEVSLAPVVQRLMGQGATAAVIDSIQIRATGNYASGTQEFPPSATCTYDGDPSGRIASEFGACWVMYLTATLPDGSTQQSQIPGWNPWWNSFGSPGTVSASTVVADIPFSQEALESFGIPSGSMAGIVSWTTAEGLNNSASEGAQARRFGVYATGARWFDGTVNTIEDPSRLTRVGHVDGVDTIFAPIPYTPNENDGAAVGGFDKQCFNRGLGFNDRAADVRFTWSGGTVTAEDVTHGVPVPFSPTAGPTWGFLTADGSGNGVIDWSDFSYIDGAIQIIRQVDGGDCNAYAGGRFDASFTADSTRLVSSASLVPVSTAGMDVTVDLENGAPLPQTGVGFGLYAYGHRFIFQMSSLPADGTVWTLRTFSGALETDNPESEDPTGYVYNSDEAGGGGGLPILIPGLKFVWDVEVGTSVNPSWDLSLVHTVPDPYLATSQFDLAPTAKFLQFVNLPPKATIRIYTLTGVLVNQIEHEDTTGGGRATWDVRNWSQQFVASGVYFYHVVTPDGDERVGKFTIVNFAGQN
ncbi:MAG: T9SS type A sorting domain-containing protein, partial [Gemmatimonadota bacterium]